MRWVRVGTLDRPELCPPGAHIYTDKKQPWLISLNIEEGAPAFEQYYEKEDVWSRDSLKRIEAVERNSKREN